MQPSTNNSVTVYLGLGSNLNNPIQQILSARAALIKHNAFQEIAFSSLYQSKPLAALEQPDYINAVMAISTHLSPLDLLHELHNIENTHGRIRTERWGARTLDIDILLYGEQVIDLPQLIVPHSGLLERAFVLYPLHEIAPHLSIPQHGSLSALLAHCSAQALQRLENFSD